MRHVVGEGEIYGRRGGMKDIWMEGESRKGDINWKGRCMKGGRT